MERTDVNSRDFFVIYPLRYEKRAASTIEEIEIERDGEKIAQGSRKQVNTESIKS